MGGSLAENSHPSPLDERHSGIPRGQIRRQIESHECARCERIFFREPLLRRRPGWLEFVARSPGQGRAVGSDKRRMTCYSGWVAHVASLNSAFAAIQFNFPLERIRFPYGRHATRGKSRGRPAAPQPQGRRRVTLQSSREATRMNRLMKSVLYKGTFSSPAHLAGLSCLWGASL